MLELRINDVDYKFNFNISFMRAMNKKHKAEAQEVWGDAASANGGLMISMMAIFADDDLDELIDVLVESNKGFDPLIKKSMIEEYIDDPDTDLDELVEQVKNSLSSSNATKKVMRKLEKLLKSQNEEENEE